MIDALFGSKTRVKLLHLFLNNPGKSFYVREITRLIDESLSGVRIVLLAGVLLKGSSVGVDLLVVGNVSAVKVKNIVKQIEKVEGREINYSVLSYDEFYYRLSVRDKFITEILNGK